jgi:hypothetical protein
MHSVHNDDFVAKAKPAAQNLHEYSVAACSSWYLPVSQSPHAVSFDDENVPAAHVRQLTEGASFSV